MIFQFKILQKAKYLIIQLRNLSIRRKFDKTMFHVRYDEQKNNFEFTFKYQLNESKERDFTFNRKGDETLGKTFQKFQTSIAKYAVLKRKKNDQPVDEFILKSELIDCEEKLVCEDLTNREAWKDNYRLKLNSQTYTVIRDAPHISKLKLQENLFTGFPALVSIECAEKIQNKSKFVWYFGENDNLNSNWTKFDEGIDKKMIIPTEQHENKYLKLECIPSDGEREGIPIKKVFKTPVKSKIDILSLPMTKRHKLTHNKLQGNHIRVMTYNVLAETYSDTEAAKTSLFPYCPLEYLDFEYRRVLLIHEIMNYNADIIFLQEVDEEFFLHDIKTALYSHGYSGFIRLKGTTKEGEVILIRNDRFKFVDNTSLNIKLSDELKNNHHLYHGLWSKISGNEVLKEQFDSRNSILQVALIESLDRPNEYLLLANTHFFFHPKADFIRLLQAIISAKYLEGLVDKFKLEGKHVSVIFAGDFNSDPGSYAFNYLFTQQIVYDLLPIEQQLLLDHDRDSLAHRLQLSTYTNFEFTNYIQTFNCILDYIFYDSSSFELRRVVPMPTREEVTENVALPSSKIPSDHLAIVFELEWKIK